MSTHTHTQSLRIQVSLVWCMAHTFVCIRSWCYKALSQMLSHFIQKRRQSMCEYLQFTDMEMKAQGGLSCCQGLHWWSAIPASKLDLSVGCSGQLLDWGSVSLPGKWESWMLFKAVLLKRQCVYRSPGVCSWKTAVPNQQIWIGLANLYFKG